MPSSLGSPEVVPVNFDPDSLADDAFLRSLLSELWQYACRITSHSHDAENVVQDTLKTLLERGAWRQQPVGQLRPWLFGVARKLALRVKRVASRHGASGSDAPERFVERTPADEAAAAEERAVCRAALASLEADVREVLILHSESTLTTKEIAEVLGLSEAGVRTRLHRARRQLEAEIRNRSQSLAESIAAGS